MTEVKGIARKYAAIGIKRGNHITYDGEPLSPVLDNEYYFDDVWTRNLETGSSTFEFTVLKKPTDNTYNYLSQQYVQMVI